MTGGGSGWGEEEWGGSAWGGAFGPALQLLAALATSENVIQLGFSHPVYFSGLLDIPDASSPARFSVAPLITTTGIDGTQARAVSVAVVQESTVIPEGGEFGAFLDLILDRPMTPYAAVYTVTCNGLFTTDLLTALDTTAASAQLFGVYREVIQPSIELPTPTRDIANPQSLITAQGLPNPNLLLQLGTFPTDATGDYAFDQGIASYKKRIWRRGMTNVGGFVHLGNDYGVGIPQQGKKLVRPATIQALAADYEKQIAREPETESVRVTAQASPENNGLVKFTILAKVRGVDQGLKFTTFVPIQ